MKTYVLLYNTFATFEITLATCLMRTVGEIITAKANGYVDFALELAMMADIYEDEADYLETINYFKYFKDV